MEESFSETLWLEDPIPAYVGECTRCELFNQRTRIIWGEGNPKANIIVVLDNPGCREDKNGNAFVCGTRQTLQHIANSIGLSEKDLYITYILKCKPVRKYQKEIARETCFGHLEQQLLGNNFRIAFCLGDVAVRTFFADADRNVKNTRGTWYHIRGLLTYVSYHPFAIRRRPNLYEISIKDWEQVALKSREQLDTSL